MLSKKTILEYQKMTPEERFALGAALSDGMFEVLAALPPAEREHRWRVIRRMHDQFSERLVAYFSKPA